MSKTLGISDNAFTNFLPQPKLARAQKIGRRVNILSNAINADVKNVLNVCAKVDLRKQELSPQSDAVHILWGSLYLGEELYVIDNTDWPILILSKYFTSHTHHYNFEFFHSLPHLLHLDELPVDICTTLVIRFAALNLRWRKECQDLSQSLEGV